MNNYELYRKFFSQEKLLLLQLSSLNELDKIYIINTSVFLGIDYFGNSKYEE